MIPYRTKGTTPPPEIAKEARRRSRCVPFNVSRFDYIRESYGVPAKRGGRILFEGRPGRIVSAYQAYIRVVFDGNKVRHYLHPTWRVDYLDGQGVRGDGN